MLHAANMSFALCPMLTAGSQELKAMFAQKLVSGEWTGTMNLTEPQAGLDLAAIRARAERQSDGMFKVFGTKIVITYGEHDMAENILHLVLARVPGATEGVKRISLFAVPKFMVQPDGTLGVRNDVHCVSIEHKLGIKASPTAVLQFGDNGGALGYLVGDENRGLEYMFIMMNAVRFVVGMQGIAVADQAHQQAVFFATERVQSRDLAGSDAPVSIIHHPDVKRMLLTMRALTHGARNLGYVAVASCDAAHHCVDAETGAREQALFEYLVPIVKGFSTEMSIQVASLGVQVHGMGFVEETGAAQHCRDARILTIYEGTTAIQANDLVGRKTVRDRGEVAKAFCSKIMLTEQDLFVHGGEDCSVMHDALNGARQALESTIEHIVANAKTDTKALYAGAVSCLMLAGYTLAGWQMARALMVSIENMGSDPDFYDAKRLTCRLFAESLLPQASALASTVLHGGETVNRMGVDSFWHPANQHLK